MDWSFKCVCVFVRILSLPSPVPHNANYTDTFVWCDLTHVGTICIPERTLHRWTFPKGLARIQLSSLCVFIPPSVLSRSPPASLTFVVPEWEKVHIMAPFRESRQTDRRGRSIEREKVEAGSTHCALGAGLMAEFTSGIMTGGMVFTFASPIFFFLCIKVWFSHFRLYHTHSFSHCGTDHCVLYITVALSQNLLSCLTVSLDSNLFKMDSCKSDFQQHVIWLEAKCCNLTPLEHIWY